MLHQRIDPPGLVTGKAEQAARPVGTPRSGGGDNGPGCPSFPDFRQIEAAALADWELGPLWQQLFDDANP